MKSLNFEMKQWGVLLVGLILLSSCQPPEVEMVEKVEEESKPVVKQPPVGVKPKAEKTLLPVDRTITNSAGIQIAVTIIGKSYDKIQFKRKSDGKKYVIPVSTLSVADQQFLTTIESSDEASFEDDGTAGGLTPVLEVKLKSVEKQLKRVIEDIEELEATKRASSLDSNSPRLRGMERELGKLQEEKAELELDVAELKGRL